ncbi:hypothetical protein HDU81_003801 [Chytriomyces hyalinus]|nr:hypothetical protein HDU81_003801 [Chytriomyces hyalinus]
MATKSSKDISNMLDSVMGAVDAAYALSEVVVYTIAHHIPCPEDDELLLRSFARTAVQKTRSNSQVLLTTLTYVDRYFSNPPKLRFDDETTARYIHYKIFISALLTGHKYVSDMTAVANIAWVNVCEGKFSMAQINTMEWDFLSKINYGVVVEDEETQKRWLDTIQDLTEKADTYMMVKISASDAISSILSSTGAVASSCSFMSGSRSGTGSGTGSTSSSRTGSVRSNASTISRNSAVPRSCLSREASSKSSRRRTSSSASSTKSVRSLDSTRGFEMRGIFDKLKLGASKATASNAGTAGHAVNRVNVARGSWDGSLGEFNAHLKNASMRRASDRTAVGLSSKSADNGEARDEGNRKWTGWKQFWSTLRNNKAVTETPP